jgi:Fe2+ transport system protein FeoA
LTKGCVFEIIQASSKGPVLIEIRGTRIALGHGLASKILVEEVSS